MAGAAEKQAKAEGTAAFESGDYGLAARRYERAAALIDDDRGVVGKEERDGEREREEEDDDGDLSTV